MVEDVERRRWGGWEFPKFELQRLHPEAEYAATTGSRARAGALGALAVTLGLGLGAFALYRWRRSKQRAAAAQPQATTPPRSTTVLRMPHTRAELEALWSTARSFVAMVADVEQQRRLVWAWSWPGVPYPSVRDPSADPRVWKVAELVRSMIDAARCEATRVGNKAEAEGSEAAATSEDEASPLLRARAP